MSYCICINVETVKFIDYFVGMDLADSLKKSDGEKGTGLYWILPLSVGLVLVILSILLICHRRRKKAIKRKTKGKLDRSLFLPDR